MAVRKRQRQNGRLDAFFSLPHKSKKVQVAPHSPFSVQPQARDPALHPYMARFAPQDDSDVLDPHLKSEVRRYLRCYGTDDAAQALLVLGPSGSGKTAALRYIARALDRKILEVSVTDERSSAGLHRVLGEATQSDNVIHTQVLLVEDVDVVTEQDRGFYKAVADLMSNSKVPIVLTAVHTPHSLLSQDRVRTYTLRNLEESAMLGRLERIAQTCGAQLTRSALQALWRLHKSNLCSVLNALHLADLGLIAALSGDVSSLTAEDTSIVARGKGLWAQYNEEQSLDCYLSFVENNSVELFSDLSQLSGLMDLLCCFDCVQTNTDLWKTEVRTLDCLLQLHRPDQVVVTTETMKADMEFPILASAESSPYRTRSKVRKSS